MLLLFKKMKKSLDKLQNSKKKNKTNTCFFFFLEGADSCQTF